MNRFQDHEERRIREIKERITKLGSNPGDKIYKAWLKKRKEGTNDDVE